MKFGACMVALFSVNYINQRDNEGYLSGRCKITDCCHKNKERERGRGKPSTAINIALGQVELNSQTKFLLVHRLLNVANFAASIKHR